MPFNMENEYKERLAHYQSLALEHKNCVGKTYNQFGLFIKCLSCEVADLDEELSELRLDNAVQSNVCEKCGSDEVNQLRNGICGSCMDETHVNDFEFGEAQEHWSSFQW